jgi:hypothetical protein
MPGPPPSAKGPQRKGPKSTRATLTKPEAEDIKVPPLPRRAAGWTGMTKAWWRDVWSSPMSSEYDDSDIHGLWSLAAVVDDFWTAGNQRDRIAAAAEIRLQSVRFGLSPMDRRRLEWQIVATDDAKDKAAKRRREAAADGQQQQPQAPARPAGVDPRSALRLA